MKYILVHLEKITEVDEDWYISKTHVIWREQA